MNINVPLEDVCDRLERLEKRLAVREASAILNQEWYTLRQAARLKRGVEVRNGQTFESFYHTLCAKPWLRPGAGVPDARIGGAAVWHRDTVRLWLNLSDEEMEAIRKVS